MALTDFRDMNHVVRLLGRLEPDTKAKKMRASQTNIQTHRVANGMSPLVPKNLWVPKDNTATFNERFILNQFQTSGCVGFSGACARMKTLFLASGKLVVLSGAFLYALINGDRDQGACITDSMAELVNTGVCTTKEFDLPNIYRRQIPNSAYEVAKIYRETYSVTVGSWLEVMTAVQMGWVVQLPVQVGPNFENFDQYGAAGFSNGVGNHSVHVDGAVLLPNGEWALTMMNTWGLWGYRKNGRCLLYQRHVDGCGTQDDAYAHGSGLAGVPQLAA